jgi:hypothetical protein
MDFSLREKSFRVDSSRQTAEPNDLDPRSQAGEPLFVEGRAKESRNFRGFVLHRLQGALDRD